MPVSKVLSPVKSEDMRIIEVTELVYKHLEAVREESETINDVIKHLILFRLNH